MNEYIEQYFNLLVNSDDISVVEELLPSIMLDKTNQIIEILISKLNEEIEVAEELEDTEYLVHLKKIILLLSARKEPIIEEEGILDKNIIILSSDIVKTLKKLNDPMYYIETLRAIECLENKQWIEGNKNNPQKYKRLHGVAYGLSEVKMKTIRLMHIPINGDFWYVSDVLKKGGDNPKYYNEKLETLTDLTKGEVRYIREKFTINGQLDYAGLIEYAHENNKVVMEMLHKNGGKKR